MKITYNSVAVRENFVRTICFKNKFKGCDRKRPDLRRD